MITSKNIYSIDFHGKIKKKTRQSYLDLITDVREDLRDGFTTPHLSEEFLASLNSIINDKSLNQYTPLSFYWSTLLENLIYVVQLHEEIQECESNTDFEFSEAEDELFNFWNDSEMAHSFLEMLDENNNIIEASSNLLTMLENQILSFFYLNITNDTYNIKDVILYNAIPEVGDHKDRLYIGNDHLIADFEEQSEIYPNIALKRIFPNKKGIEVELNTDLYEVPLKENESSINMDSNKLFILPNCELGKKKLSEFQNKIELALNVIKDSSRGLYDTFQSFTHSIVPVNEEDIVSYSMQSLPGFSSINMFDRDFLDLMDDLLHENGHHYLNTFLNHTELMHEDDEKIYYSPWRRALRPIRGIYHATFTFSWALQLFCQLDQSESEHYKFTAEEKAKIKRRAIEEYYMLTYCYADLESAFEEGKVTPEGNQLILSIFDLISSYKEQVLTMKEELKELSTSDFESVNELINLLKEKRAHYEIK